MPFIYSLHDELALRGGGALILGVVALVWTVDCFVSLWLTFPPAAHARRPPGVWVQKWGKAWRVRWPTRVFKLTFDLHTALGLWLWIMLGVLAWSGVAFNLPEVYQPVTKALFGLDEAPEIRTPAPPSARRPPSTGARPPGRPAGDGG